MSKTIEIGQTWEKVREDGNIQIKILNIFVFIPGYKDEPSIFYEYEDTRNGRTESRRDIGIHKWFDDHWTLLNE